MPRTINYGFDDVCIRIEDPSAGLTTLISDYTCLESGRDTAVHPCVSVSFVENYIASGLQAIVPGGCVVEAETKIMLRGERLCSRYSTGGSDIWYVYQDYGAVHIDLNIDRIESYYCSSIGPTDLQPFLVLFINPLLSALRKFGYQYLHAAACRVLGNNILFSGLSGRGKSTAALALAIKGHGVMTDESVLLREKDGRVYAVALMNWIKVSRAAIRRLWPWFGKGIPISDTEFAVKASELNMEPPSKFERIDYVCILQQTGKEETSIQVADALEMVPEMLPTSVNAITKESMGRSFVFLTDFIKGVECRKVSFGMDMDLFVFEVERLADWKGDSPP
jgi:hypothetical protein